MTNERYAVGLRGAGFFAPLPAASMPHLADVAPVARYPGDTAVTGLVSPFGLAYRTDLVKMPPRAWRDLWNAEYKGQIGFYSIDKLGRDHAGAAGRQAVRQRVSRTTRPGCARWPS